MSANGQSRNADGLVLHWTGRVLAAEDLRRSLNGHRELVLTPQAVVTPLAAEELRARGVQVRRQASENKPQAAPSWGVAQERPHALVASAVQALRREGLGLAEL